MQTGNPSRQISSVVLVLSTILMLAGIAQIFAQDFYAPTVVGQSESTIHSPPQSQSSNVTLPSGASVEFKSRYPGVTMIVVAGVLHIFLMLSAAIAERVVGSGANNARVGADKTEADVARWGDAR